MTSWLNYIWSFELVLTNYNFRNWTSQARLKVITTVYLSHNHSLQLRSLKHNKWKITVNIPFLARQTKATTNKSQLLTFSMDMQHNFIWRNFKSRHFWLHQLIYYNWFRVWFSLWRICYPTLCCRSSGWTLVL